MRVEVQPTQAVAMPKNPVVLTVTVTNTSEVISGHQVRVLGVDPAWVHIDEERLSLFPGATGTAVVTLTLPPGLPAGQRRLAVQVRELTSGQDTAVVEVDLQVPSAQEVDLQMDPMSVTGGRSASFGLLVQNTGNTSVSGPLAGADEEAKMRFRFTPAELELGPGEHAAVTMRVSGPRRVAGNPAVRPFQVRLLDGRELDDLPRATGTFVQRPWLSRGSLSLVGLLAAVTVFALVITYALSGVVGRSAADRDLALQVAQAQHDNNQTGTAGLAGTVRLLTSNAPVPGVTVEVFDASDTANPVTSVATDDKGVYTFTGLPQGSYKLRFRGAGFAEMWYPQALTDSDATAVDVQPGQTKSGLDVRLGGLPATISGTVLGDDPTGASVALMLPGTAAASAQGVTVSSTSATSASGGDSADPASTGAILRTVKVGADGSFALDDVPSPSVYDLAVSKAGYATEVQRIDVGGGETRKGVEIHLRKGDGLIAGHVTGADGPLGGATISATYGDTTARTVSLTQDDVGAFTLRGLPTPATFTLVVSKPGLASQTLTLSLSSGQQLTGVGVTLGGSSGSLSGVVRTLADHAAAGGVSVSVTNGALTVQTVTQSTGTVGAWKVGGLPVPSTYTVTFSRADLASQTVSVSLDAFGNVTSGGSATGVDASLRSSTATLRGTADQRSVAGDATAIGEVLITVTSGGSTWQTTTASVPDSALGQYELDGLPPGTYTVSVNRRGARPTSTIITLAAGDDHVFDPVLAHPASVSGTVTGADGNAVAGAEVKLYLASQYPAVVARTTTADAQGHYSFPDVDAPQSYVVEFDSPPGSNPQGSRTVTVQQSQDLTVDLAARPATPSSPTGAPS